MTSKAAAEARPGHGDEALAVAGVSLVQYAAVVAALGEEIPLEEVLAVEGLDDDEWRAAEAGYRLLLCRDAAALER